MEEPLIDQTNFTFPGQVGVYHGKVRDVYDLGQSLLFVASDRYSAFDRILAHVPQKGALLTAISRWWFEQTTHITKNHVIGYPDPNVAWGHKYEVVPIEMVVRGYITGVTNTSLWHTYSLGKRDYGTFKLPEGLHKNAKLPQPVLTPTTKFEAHDRNLTPAEAVAEGLLDQATWDKIQTIALELFKFGQKTAHERGLILVDTKYEFGRDSQGNIVLIDEIHTPDSSRYWRTDTYEASIKAGTEPDNYDKEYLRLWFKERFDPYADSKAPEATPEVIAELKKRYIYVYEQLTGQAFMPQNGSTKDALKRIEQGVMHAINEKA
ncbi:MAG TPA: phosphoribosylaminoimidazolesuccinocarboxamide synthase [Candidatus Saccharimonadia bacterium]|jgi:phosphoribosylaminoimidazole-succinocarboxamide synthase|nr:phosphoribosylaminoimidazolesuccinocarboxamide synthase [Candidatus Saccharimonadia bacterium]